MTPMGPYETEQAATTEPMPQAVRKLPFNMADPGRASRELMLSFLREACADAGVELGRYDERILTWLASYEPATVQVVIGLISRARNTEDQERLERAQRERDASEDRVLELRAQLDRATGWVAHRFLIWSNEHRMWWRANERGYTDAIEEAGRYSYAKAAAIVRLASVDGRVLRDRTDPITGREYKHAPEVLVLAPESFDLEGGVTRG